jgi:hypothetical protein
MANEPVVGKIAFNFSSGSAKGKQMHAALLDWRSDFDLVLVRDPVKMQSFSPDEREQRSAFWKQVNARLTR